MLRTSQPKTLTCVVLCALVSAIFFYLNTSVSVQASREIENKLDSELQNLTRQKFRAEESRERIRINEDAGTVGVIMTLDSEDESQTIEASGIRARIGNLAVAEVKIEDLSALAALPNVRRLQSAKFKTPLSIKQNSLIKPVAATVNDAANSAIKAAQARTENNVTGKGVVVGMIDSGIDWRHGDFRKADGTTRVKVLWDMSDVAGTGPGGVGRVYSETEINNALQGSSTINEKDVNGHGTHVAGTAAGNGLGTGNSVAAGTYTGIAPEADLIVVKATRSTTATASFADDDLIAAMSFVRMQATALNEPFVINLSVGGHYSSHDGTDPLEIAVDNLIATGKGRQVVIAAGNEGKDNIHAGGVLGQNSDTTIPFSVTGNASGMIAVYPGNDAITAKIIKPNGAVVGPVKLYDLLTNDPDVELENAPGETATAPKAILVTFKQRPTGNWKLILTGTKINNGRFDVWTQDAGETVLDAAVRDNLCSVASPATARRAISVANYVTKTNYIDITGTSQNRTAQGSIGRIASSSSLGPSRDGRLSPQIAAPGSYIASSLSADYQSDSLIGGAPAPEFVTNDGGKHYVTYGTSMAAASVTGTVALMLQANRNLEPDQIRRLLIRTATSDGFTGSSISPQFGYGKLDAMEAVKAATETIPEFVNVSSASYLSEYVAAPEMILSGFGNNLTTSTEAATTTLPTILAGISVKLTDLASNFQLAPLFYVSPNQINYQVPATVGFGTYKVEVVKTDGSVVARGSLNVNTVWPGLFSATQNGRGLAAADVLRIKANGERVYESVNNPINLSNAADKVFLQLYGTGLRGRSSISKVKAFLGGTPLIVDYVGAQNFFIGLDQINVQLPNSLAGRNRTLDLIVYVDGWNANTVQCRIQ